jgi:pre-mRNA-processing factor 17
VGTAVHNAAPDPVTFDEERKRFQRTGCAAGPGETGTEVVRGTWGHSRQRYAGKEEEGRPRKRGRGRKEEDGTGLVEGSDDEATYGIWAPPSAEERARMADQVSDLAGGGEAELAPEQLAERAHLAERDRRRGRVLDSEADEAQRFDRLVERKMSHLLPPRMEGEEPVAMEPVTTFHGGEEADYRGRPWTAAPAGAGTAEPGNVDDHPCFVPKKCVARLTGHTKGVHRIRFHPGTGHLLLSAGLEGKCKVWNVATRRVMRTYHGHTAAVRDVRFSDDGSTFLSASFDRFVRLWDTASGKVLGTYTNRRVPYVVRFYPHDNGTFVAGCSDNKVVAYDSGTGEITQEYNHHLAPVNTINFVEDQGTKMITSSDDKKILIWEWDIGVPVKYISDPTMHSIPVITLHPGGSYFAGQSLDNQIVVYQARERFAQQKKKKFTGHNVAGYACDLAISPDGRFLASGDGDGRLHFWDWRRGRPLQKYRAHDDGPAIACAWHPVEPAMVATCGWDGIIKVWQ